MCWGDQHITTFAKQESNDPTPITSIKPVTPRTSIDDSFNAGLDWIITKQKADGGWGQANVEESDPGITGLVLKGLAINGVTPTDNPWMQKAIDKLLTYQKEDGSFYLQSLQSYVTAITLSALAEIDRDKYAVQIEKGKKYLLGIQFKPNEERTAKEWYVGGITYNDEPQTTKPIYNDFCIGRLEGCRIVRRRPSLAERS